MGEHTIRVSWSEGSKPLLAEEHGLLDEQRAARVFRRLCEVLKALLRAESSRGDLAIGLALAAQTLALGLALSLFLAAC